MPIRFRCAYCSQLMGIARRKAGTVVSCPTCHGQVVVPDPGPDEPDQPAPGGDQPALFERSDFDEVFGPPREAPAPPPVPAPAPAAVAPAPEPPPAGGAAPGPAGRLGTQPEVSFDVERINAPAPAAAPHAGQSGIWLTPTAMTLLSLLVVVLLAVAFVGGLLVGRSLGSKKTRGASKSESRYLIPSGRLWHGVG
jgi:hypothetical protein